MFHIAKETVFQRRLLFLLPYRGTGQKKICLTLFLPEIGVFFLCSSPCKSWSSIRASQSLLLLMLKVPRSPLLWSLSLLQREVSAPHLKLGYGAQSMLGHRSLAILLVQTGKMGFSSSYIPAFKFMGTSSCSRNHIVLWNSKVLGSVHAAKWTTVELHYIPWKKNACG